MIDITTQNIGGRYDGFIKALTETNQCHIVELLASEISQLRGTQGHKAGEFDIYNDVSTVLNRNVFSLSY